MLNLDTKLKLDAELIKATNLADRFSEDELKRLGEWVQTGYKEDLQTREHWQRRNEAGLDLAMQIQKDKNFPWANCSNVAFPIITIASLQFHSRAYPALVPPKGIVRAQAYGEDKEGKKANRAMRIGSFMSYQVQEEDEPWEEGQDSLLLNYSIVGTAFKKSFHSGAKSHNVSEFVMAKDLVMNYWAKSVEDCPRKTHIIPLSRNEIWEYAARGMFCDVRKEDWFTHEAPLPVQRGHRTETDNRAGAKPPAKSDETTPFISLEQHCVLDLDGDGYAEPYIITIEQSSSRVLRIVANFNRPEDIERESGALPNAPGWWKLAIIRITATEYFTRYVFLPSPDGGIYGMGFGVLLGPLNESINTALNQLFDGGTVASMGGGFLGRGAKLRGGQYDISPLKWHRVDSTGDDLHKSIVPFEVREPSMVLFQVLQLLLQYTDRIPGVTEMSVGENPGQNTPAETSRTMLAQGMKIYTAIYKRAWRSMKEEFKKLYKLNAVFLDDTVHYGTDNALAMKEDFLGDPREVCPAADPNITSDEVAMMQATQLIQAAYQRPGYSYIEAEHRWLKAMKIEGIDAVYPGPGKVTDPPLPGDPKAAAEQMKQQIAAQRLQLDKMIASAKLMEEHKVNEAIILELQTKAVADLAGAQGIESGHRIAAFEAALGALKHHNENILKQAELMLASAESSDGKGSGKSPGISLPGMAAAPGDQEANAMAEAPGG